MDGPERRPHLNRDVGAVGRQLVCPEVEMPRFVLAARQNERRRGKAGLADALRLPARHGILHIPREAPPVHERIRRRLLRCAERRTCHKRRACRADAREPARDISRFHPVFSLRKHYTTKRQLPRGTDAIGEMSFTAARPRRLSIRFAMRARIW